MTVYGDIAPEQNWTSVEWRDRHLGPPLGKFGIFPMTTTRLAGTGSPLIVLATAAPHAAGATAAPSDAPYPAGLANGRLIAGQAPLPSMSNFQWLATAMESTASNHIAACESPYSTTVREDVRSPKTHAGTNDWP